MGTGWIIDAFIRQHLTKHKELTCEDKKRYLEDDKMFVCDCCNVVWERLWCGDINMYKDFPTIGKKTKRMPGHEEKI